MVSTLRWVLLDDLDASTDDVQPVWIGLDGDLFEVDLSAAHRRQLHAALAPFIAHARPVPDGEQPATPSPLRPTPAPASSPAAAARRAPAAAGAAPPRAQRTRPVVLPMEDPAYPWIPFKSAGPELARRVQAWAAQRGIPMPHRGIPRSVLLAYRQDEQNGQRDGGTSTA